MRVCHADLVDDLASVGQRDHHPTAVRLVSAGRVVALGPLGLMRRFGFPISPMIVGAILGPLAEVQLRRALDIAGGDVLTLVSTPFTIVVYVTLAAALVGGYLRRRRAVREVVAPAAGEPEVDAADGAQQPSK